MNSLASFLSLHVKCTPGKAFQSFLIYIFFVTETCNAGNEFSVSIKFPTFLQYLIASHVEVCPVVLFLVIFTTLSEQVQILKFPKKTFLFWERGRGGQLQLHPRFVKHAVVGARCAPVLAPLRRAYAALFLPFPIRS